MRVIGMLLPTLLLGCSNLNYQKCWRQPPPPESRTESGIVVRIVDARPKWEQKPFRDAITLYSLQDTTPPVWEQLESSIASFANELREPLERIEVTVRSIQLVAKDSYKLAQEAEDRRVIDFDSSESNILGVLLIGVPMGVLQDVLREKRYPDVLWHVPDGTTCALKADVSISWAGGRLKSIPVSVVATTDLPGERQPPQDPASEAVRLAMLSVREQLRNGLEAPRGP